MSWTTERTESGRDSPQESSRVIKRCMMSSRQPQLRATGRITDDLGIRKSYHTFTADVHKAYFDADEDEVCCVGPSASWLEQQAAVGSSTSVLRRLRKQLYGRRRWVDFMAEALKSKIAVGATQQYNSSQTTGWMCSWRYTRMVSMAPKRTSHRKSVSNIWTVRERVLHRERTGIVPEAKNT